MQDQVRAPYVHGVNGVQFSSQSSLSWFPQDNPAQFMRTLRTKLNQKFQNVTHMYYVQLRRRAGFTFPGRRTRPVRVLASPMIWQRQDKIQLIVLQPRYLLKKMPITSPVGAAWVGLGYGYSC
jgi:hypothetical protein